MWRAAMILMSAVLGASACGSSDDGGVRVLTYNIGNPDADHATYPLRLKEQLYEDYMGEQIRGLAPDIVFLQEVLPPAHCAALSETDPAYTCYDAANRDPAAVRILGADYSVVCDQRRQVECIGVHTDFGTIDGVPAGGFVLEGAETPPLPMPGCEYADGTCDNTKCDLESTVSAVTVQTSDGSLRLVHVHPNAPGNNASGVYTGAPCRALQLTQVFEGVSGAGDTPLVDDKPAIVAGDFNMDPVRLADSDEMALWAKHVGAGKRFTDFTPVDENGAQHATRRAGLGLAIDHVLADSASGECIVHGDDFIGTDPGTLPLDQGFDWSQVPDGEFYVGRIDHFAISCDFELSAAP